MIGTSKKATQSDNAPSHTTKLIKETIEAFSWEILSHAAYSPDLADYHLFASMGHVA